MAIWLSCLQIGLGILRVEIVDVINAMRTTGKPILRHDNFMARIDGHPGIDHLRYKGVYLGRERQARTLLLPA
jgi:hypothetical protein